MYVTNEGEVNLEEQQTNHQQSFKTFVYIMYDDGLTLQLS